MRRTAGRLKEWFDEHMDAVLIMSIALIGAIAFAVAFKQIDNDREGQHASEVQHTKENRALIKQITATGNEAIVRGCQRNNKSRNGTVAFLNSFGDNYRRALVDPASTRDVKVSALAALANIEDSIVHYKRNVPMEHCVGPLTTLPTLP